MIEEELIGSLILAFLVVFNGLGWILGWGYGQGIWWFLVLIEILLGAYGLYLINNED